jgi:hypothetical protein
VDRPQRGAQCHPLPPAFAFNDACGSKREKKGEAAAACPKHRQGKEALQAEAAFGRWGCIGLATLYWRGRVPWKGERARPCSKPLARQQMGAAPQGGSDGRVGWGRGGGATPEHRRCEAIGSRLWPCEGQAAGACQRGGGEGGWGGPPHPDAPPDADGLPPPPLPLTAAPGPLTPAPLPLTVAAPDALPPRWRLRPSNSSDTAWCACVGMGVRMELGVVRGLFRGLAKGAFQGVAAFHTLAAHLDLGIQARALSLCPGVRLDRLKHMA